MNSYIIKLYAHPDSVTTTAQPDIKINDWSENDIVPDESIICRCWHCTLPADKFMGIPYDIINNEYYTFGKFCCYSCAMAYIESSIKEGRDRYRDYLYGLYHEDHNGMIIPSPPKEMLLEYGGSYTPKMYKGLIGKDNIIIYDSKTVNTPQQHKIIELHITPNENKSLKPNLLYQTSCQL
jgi:hypothetical protein